VRADAYINCRVTSDTKAVLRKMASREGITESALVKQLLGAVLRTSTIDALPGLSLPTPLQTATYIAGIYNNSLSGLHVVVTSTGQLGVAGKSSERFKTAVATMGSNTAKLGQLRPVTFKLKSDATGMRQYGLIAEEVAKVYPELVIRDQAGRIDGVRYDELAPMLLNEVQQQQQKIDGQAGEISDLKQQMAELKALYAR
jgi:hypothetical protein